MELWECGAFLGLYCAYVVVVVVSEREKDVPLYSGAESEALIPDSNELAIHRAKSPINIPDDVLQESSYPQFAFNADAGSERPQSPSSPSPLPDSTCSYGP